MVKATSGGYVQGLKVTAGQQVSDGCVLFRVRLGFGFFFFFLNFALDMDNFSSIGYNSSYNIVTLSVWLPLSNVLAS